MTPLSACFKCMNVFCVVWCSAFAGVMFVGVIYCVGATIAPPNPSTAPTTYTAYDPQYVLLWQTVPNYSPYHAVHFNVSIQVSPDPGVVPVPTMLTSTFLAGTRYLRGFQQSPLRIRPFYYTNSYGYVYTTGSSCSYISASWFCVDVVGNATHISIAVAGDWRYSSGNSTGDSREAFTLPAVTMKIAPDAAAITTVSMPAGSVFSEISIAIYQMIHYGFCNV
eukprot:TRINITY_DN3356_c0_g2_i1.p1 TRINITY_DN3356_c0_g2~~TRINITY_DN3356_c0_g2_i1.p1  ORF type:complete len:232 (-),score=20.76 TRINITY_DN3356_c0_g2_i1:26-691(-)